MSGKGLLGRVARGAAACALGLALVAAPSVAEARVGAPTYGFTDVAAGDWYANDRTLGYALEQRIMSGYGNGTFGPWDQVDRATVVTVLYNMAGSPKVSAGASAGFSDVDYSQWYGDAVRWGRSVGVANGVGSNLFQPTAPVSREQMATFMRNYATKVAGLATDDSEAKASGIAGWGEVSPWAREGMAWAVNAGLISGSVEGGVAYLRPLAGAQRAQLAAVGGGLKRLVVASFGEHEHQWVPVTEPVYEERPVYQERPVYEERPVYQEKPVYTWMKVTIAQFPDGKTYKYPWYPDQLDSNGGFKHEVVIKQLNEIGEYQDKTGLSYVVWTTQENVQTGTEKVQTGTEKVQVGTEKVQVGTERVQVGTKTVAYRCSVCGEYRDA